MNPQHAGPARLIGRYNGMPEMDLLALDHRLGARERQVYDATTKMGPNWALSVVTQMNQHSIIGRHCCERFHNQPPPLPEVVPLDYDEDEVEGCEAPTPPLQLTFLDPAP
jgi:hypothetical protein